MRRVNWLAATGALVSVLAIYPLAQAAPIVPAAPEPGCGTPAAGSEPSCAAPVETTRPAPRPPTLPPAFPPSMLPQPRPAAPGANPPAGALVPPAAGSGRGTPIVPAD
ncbi:hypothetical protein [Nocardia sp. NPDC050710]|uniref:hypothetical protein n=1 Tax=Nocardia sp. NPDC050710 TaxID=3157220 RepID=UPI0033C0A6FC